MLVGFQRVIIADEEEAHGSHQELKQLDQRGVTPVGPHLQTPTQKSQHTRTTRPVKRLALCYLLMLCCELAHLLLSYF